jgi:peptidoglycan/LPS O-acetylase OafA/YrhL
LPTIQSRAPQLIPPISYLPALDGVRAIAILLVICVHFCQLYLEKSHSMIWRLGLGGQTGVDLFFVLSGFLITRILLDAKGSPHFLRNFYVRRALRIFPLYYLTLIALFVILPALHITPWVPAKQSFWYWIYLHNIPLTFNPALLTGPNHFWSLAVEEHFYLVWPFVVLMLSTRNLYKAVAAAVAVSLLSRMVWAQYDTYYLTLARLDGLALGAAIAVFASTQPNQSLARLVPWAKGIFGAVAIAMLVPLVLPHFQLLVMRVLRNTLIALLFASGLVLIIENRSGIVSRLLSTPFMRSIGKYSYAMYIFHPFILDWMYARGMTYSLPWLLAGAALTYIAGWISWHALEKPILSLKRYFEYVPLKEGAPGGGEPAIMHGLAPQSAD